MHVKHFVMQDSTIIHTRHSNIITTVINGFNLIKQRDFWWFNMNLL